MRNIITLCAIVFCVQVQAKLVRTVETINAFDILEISKSVYIVSDKKYGTNIGVFIGNDSMLLIDPMPGSKRLKDLETLLSNISKHPVKYVINTHSHQDHSGGNAYFSRLGATVVDVGELSNPKTTGSDASTVKIKSDLAEFGFEFSNVESHTSNDLAIYHESTDIIFVGDVFDNSWHPTFYAGGLKGLTSSLDAIFALSQNTSTFIPGHGRPAKKSVVEAFQKNTKAWVQRVRELKDKNISVDEMMNDSAINTLLQKFNTENRTQFIPKKAFRRFIERTLQVLQNH